MLSFQVEGNFSVSGVRLGGRGARGTGRPGAGFGGFPVSGERVEKAALMRQTKWRFPLGLPLEAPKRVQAPFKQHPRDDATIWLEGSLVFNHRLWWCLGATGHTEPVESEALRSETDIQNAGPLRLNRVPWWSSSSQTETCE